MSPKDRTWLETQMIEYRRDKATYQELAKTLAEILRRICDQVAPGARTDGRPKTEFSFAEKILRKRSKYGDEPLKHIRDLAGARAIVYTSDEVVAVCRAIEKLDGHGLQIEWKNCVNVRQELGTDRFRYSGMHYVVELKGDPILGVVPDTQVYSTDKTHLFAEIQVCTFLQHVWSAISHDRIYKPELKAPKILEREVNALSAMLESADNAFARAIHDLDAYSDEFDANQSDEKLEDQIDTWTEVCKQCPKSSKAAYELGRRLLAAERWDDAVVEFSKIKDSPRERDTELRASDHRVKLHLARAALRSDREGLGRKLLAEIVAADSGNINALALLGTSYLEEGKLSDAGRWLEDAFNLRADDPAVLMPYLELLLRRPEDPLAPSDLQVLQGTLKAAIHRCQEYEDRRVFLPDAHFYRGRFRLLLGKAYQPTAKSDGDQPDCVYAALDAYCRAIAASRTCTPILDELNAIERILKDRCPDGPAGFEKDDADHHRLLCASTDWEGLELVRMLLRVALVAKSRQCLDISLQRGEADWQIREENESYRMKLKPLLSHGEENGSPELSAWPAPIVIVAGGCDEKHGPHLIRTYTAAFNAAFKHFEGTVIGGGTTAGVSGMVAKLANPKINKIGYLPPKDQLPPGDKTASQYLIRRTFGRSAPPAGKRDREYSKSGPIQLWADLLFDKNTDPSRVRLLGIDGGKISGFEFRLAVAMGAMVGVVVDSQRAVKSLLEDKSWAEPEGLVPLPTDAATWSAFIRSASPELTKLESQHIEIEKAAAFAHEEYRMMDSTQRSARKHHPSVLPWDYPLAPEYKESNLNQIRFAMLILRDAGYDVRSAVADFDLEKPPIPETYPEKVEEMAELEHGRFVAERLSHGWRYGTENDLAKKTNPTLVAWNLLDGTTKEYDRIAVRNYPRWLARAGLVIVEAHKV